MNVLRRRADPLTLVVLAATVLVAASPLMAESAAGSPLAEDAAVLVRDPDGHALMLVGSQAPPERSVGPTAERFHSTPQDMEP